MKDSTLVRLFHALIMALIATTFSASQSSGHASQPPETPVFRYHLSVEPSGINPAAISSSESNFFLVNVLRGLYFVDEHGESKPELAQSCTWTKPHVVLECILKKEAKWSNGQQIVAQDFVESWRQLVLPGAKGIGAAILANVKNARALHSGQNQTATNLGIRAKDSRTLEIELEISDSEFLQALSHPALTVAPNGVNLDRQSSTTVPTSGPYRVSSWTSKRIRLESNPHYFLKAERPAVEVLMLDDDETAMNLYRAGTLTFLRRLPTHYLKTWNNSKELHQIPVARFDYIGFGPELRPHRSLRQALAAALNYTELQQLYSALGIPGCPGIDPRWMNQVPCHTFNLKRAQELWSQVPADLKNKRIAFGFSKLAGDSIQQGMEWAQAQWKKNLGFTVELKPTEQTVYLATLRENPPAIFRKGVGLDRSTCRAAVEIFSQGDPENFIRLADSKYEGLLKKLSAANSPAQAKQACSNAIRYLIDQAEIIPLGRIHFAMLAKESFNGWRVTPLNQLDLSRLRVVQK